ncbi:MAG: ABC transporter ATP-binding protein [Butyricicoccaceae bacterium]
MNNNRPYLSVDGLEKSFGAHKVFENICFDIRQGEFISLLGPSGCGKTTLLRCLMGLEMPDSGHVFLEDREITRQRCDKRGFSIVFQDYGLFPHMTIFDNVAYPLRLQKMPREQIRSRVNEALASLGLEEAAKKSPAQLSGGMQQRAAIARSLVTGSKLLLFDEPFSALDAMVKVELSDELKSLQRRFGITMLMVTHDQIDAISLSDRILLMNEGHIVADDSPGELYRTADAGFAKSFFADQIDRRVHHAMQLRR